MSNQKIMKAIAGIAAAGMMATCLPVAAFAATGDTYHFSFSNGFFPGPGSGRLYDVPGKSV